MKRVWQFLPTISNGDAVSNECLAISALLSEKGIENRIAARYDHLRRTSDVRKFEKARKEIEDDDLILYHLSVGEEMNDWFSALPNRKVLIYHNITPSRFFRKYSTDMCRAAEEGREQLARMASAVDAAITVSSYNASELMELGFPKPSVIPILIPFGDYDRDPDPKRMQELSDGKTNILFVGRVAPNKCQEDILSVFAEYRKNYDPQARLILAGSYTGMELYFEKIKKYVEKLGLGENVILTGHTSFPEILAFYRSAHAFVIMSEHEGFCVPVVEAFYFGVPVMACDYGAIGETMGNAGVLLDHKDPSRAAAVLNEMVHNEEWRKEEKLRMKEELARFDEQHVKDRIWEVLCPLLGKQEM